MLCLHQLSVRQNRERQTHTRGYRVAMYNPKLVAAHANAIHLSASESYGGHLSPAPEVCSADSPRQVSLFTAVVHSPPPPLFALSPALVPASATSLLEAVQGPFAMLP